MRRLRIVALFAAVSLPLCALPSLTGTADAATTNTLRVGQKLLKGQSLVSADTKYKALMRADGHLVVVAPGGAVKWSSPTHTPGSYVTMQADGSLVIASPANATLWSTHTPGAGNRLVMQNGGKLVVLTAGALPLWSNGSGTSYAVDTLKVDQTLASGQSLVALNGQFRATMTTHGDFTVTDAASNLKWASKTQSPGSHVVMQGDGNLVVYSTDNVAQWSSKTAPSSGDILVMQNDGNLVIYSRGNVALWASKIGVTGYSMDTLRSNQLLSGGQSLWSKDGQYQAAMQSDGNFVVYGPSGPTWSTLTFTPGSYIVMQSDGNLVVYTKTGRPLWSSNSAPSSDDRLVMNNGGRLSVYTNGSSTEVWANAGTSIGSQIYFAGRRWLGTHFCGQGGDYFGPTHGSGNADGANQCSRGVVGFDSIGIAAYAVFQGTGGNVRMPHDASIQTVSLPPHEIDVALDRSAWRTGDILVFNNGARAGIYFASGSPKVIYVDIQSNKFPDGVHERSVLTTPWTAVTRVMRFR